MSIAPHPVSRRGFSLVLSLTIMAMMVMIVIVLAAFLSVESKLAKAAQYRTQSKLHALVSLRLALAHLQQEAGPDRRMTAHLAAFLEHLALNRNVSPHTVRAYGSDQIGRAHA